MKHIQKAIYEKLKNLVGGDVFVNIGQQNKTKFIVITKKKGSRWRDINGPAGIEQVNIRVDCYDPEYYLSEESGGGVKDLLDGLKETVIHNSESIKICGISLSNEDSLIDNTGDPQLYRKSLNFLVTYEY